MCLEGTPLPTLTLLPQKEAWGEDTGDTDEMEGIIKQYYGGGDGLEELVDIGRMVSK